MARQRADASGEAACEKEAWVSRVLLEWGSCGRVLYVDDRARRLRAVRTARPTSPEPRPSPPSPVSEDAVLLAALAVLPEYAGGGLGRVLVQAVVKDVVQRGGIRAIEAFGDLRPRSRKLAA